MTSWFIDIQGVTITIHGRSMFIQGGVLFALADTLAAHDIGGFKVGVGFSLRKCRMCMATRDQMSVQVNASILYCLIKGIVLYYIIV